MKFKFLLEEYGDDLAKTIRNDLKKAGYKVPAQVTVKQRRGGYSTALDVVIKDLHVDFNDVNDIAHKYEVVRRDVRSGDILSGANTYIFVKYDDRAEEAAKEMYRPKVIEIIQQGLADEGRPINVGKGLEISFPLDDSAYSKIDIRTVEPWTRTSHGWPIDQSYVAEYKGKMIGKGYGKKTPLWRLLFDYGIEP